MVFLGLEFNTITQLVCLPQDKQHKIKVQVQSLLHRPTVHMAMKVLGLMVSAIEAVPFAQIQLRALQANILSTWKGGPLSRTLILPQTTREALQWWLRTDNLATGQSWVTPDWNVISSDASLKGWGGAHGKICLHKVNGLSRSPNFPSTY